MKNLFIKLTLCALVAPLALNAQESAPRRSLYDYAKGLVYPLTAEDMDRRNALFFGLGSCLLYPLINYCDEQLENVIPNATLRSGTISVGAVYGLYRTVFVLEKMELERNPNFKFSPEAESKIRDFMRERLPEYRAELDKTIIVKEAHPHEDYSAVASLWFLPNKRIFISQRTADRIQCAANCNQPLHPDLKFALLHEFGHIVQMDSLREHISAAKKGWLPFESRAHKSLEVSADVFAINRLKPEELNDTQFAETRGSLHTSDSQCPLGNFYGYMTADQLRYVMQQRLKTFPAQRKTNPLFNLVSGLLNRKNN